jgi:hypothetical protein
LEGVQTPNVVVNKGEEGSEGLFSTYFIYNYMFKIKFILGIVKNPSLPSCPISIGISSYTTPFFTHSQRPSLF